MCIRGIRGAITVRADQSDLILQATQKLLTAVLRLNPSLRSEEIASVFFTITPDLISVHPAKAARMMGWTSVPLMCFQEIPVPGGLPRVIRVLVLWNTELAQDEIRHAYLGEAARLRQDLGTGHR